MLRFFGSFFFCLLALACGGSTPVVTPPTEAVVDAPQSAAIRWQKETPIGVRALEMLAGGDLLFFAAGQQPAPPRVIRSQDGLETAAYPLAVHPDARITSGDDKVLVVRGQDLDVYSIEGGRLFHIELPAEQGSIAAFASGYADSAFIITSRGTLHIATPSGLRGIETSVSLSRASHMQRVGGRLIVARGESLWSVSLSDGEVNEWATGLGEVKEFVRDDEGRYIVLNAEREVSRVDPDGTSVQISGAPGQVLAADLIAYDLGGHTLAILDAEHSRLQAYDYLALTGRTATPSERVGPFTVAAALGSAGLTGAEYLTFSGSTTRTGLLSGFYPEQGVMFDGEVTGASASEAALACMEQSHAALRTFVERHAALLVQVARAAPDEMSSRFYLMVDDYSAADDPFPEDMRAASMWYWLREPAVPGRIPGYWKWEAVLLQNGDCDIPNAEAATAVLQERIRSARPPNND